MNKTKVCFGIQSITEDDQHIFMLDYDGDNYKFFKTELRKLQSEYKLSDVYILKTSNGYNAFSMDKLEKEFLLSILASSQIVDVYFTTIGLLRGHWTLRMGNDKYFMGTMISQHDLYDKSLAHYNFFVEIMQYPIYKDNTYDDFYEYKIDAYRSVKNGWADLKI